MIQICTCFKFIFRTGSLEDIWCDDRCCGCWCHGDMNQDTSIHRADSDAHCIHPTSQMIILLKIVSRAVWPNMTTRIQVMAWCLCGAGPMPEPIYPVLSFIDLWQDQMVGFLLLCVCVCIFCEFSFFILFFLFFLFSWFGIQSTAMCNCVCTDVSLCSYYDDLVNNMELIPGITNHYCFESTTVWCSALNYGRWWWFEPAEIPTISFLVRFPIRNGIRTLQGQVEKTVRWRTVSWFDD